MLDIAPYDKKAIEKLIHQIEQTNPLAEKSWLLQQARQLAKEKD